MGVEGVDFTVAGHGTDREQFTTELFLLKRS
jgi:hypothetical protein